MAKSELEEDLLRQIEKSVIPFPEREFRFHPVRKWRFDFAYPDRKIGVECEGGIWTRGRHVRAAGFEGDCEKYNAAALLGWAVFRFTGGMIKRGEAISILEEAFEEEFENE